MAVWEAMQSAWYVLHPRWVQTDNANAFAIRLGLIC